MSKLFSRRWLAQASYTWSEAPGELVGLIRTDGRPVLPQPAHRVRDLVSMMGNRTGPLGGNRTTEIKAAGSYLLSLGREVSLAPGIQLSAISGAPANAWGGHPVYGAADGFLLPRGMAGELPWQVSLDLSARVTWTLSGPYARQLHPERLQRARLPGGNERGSALHVRFHISSAKGRSARPRTPSRSPIPRRPSSPTAQTWAYARTINRLRVTPNLNYGRATAFQTPVSARFGVALSF